MDEIKTIECIPHRVKHKPGEIVSGAIDNLLYLMERAREMCDEEPSFKDAVALLEVSGRTSIRLLTLLKAEVEFLHGLTKGEALAVASARLMERERLERSLAEDDPPAAGEPMPPA